MNRLREEEEAQAKRNEREREAERAREEKRAKEMMAEREREEREKAAGERRGAKARATESSPAVSSSAAAFDHVLIPTFPFVLSPVSQFSSHLPVHIFSLSFSPLLPLTAVHVVSVEREIRNGGREADEAERVHCGRDGEE